MFKGAALKMDAINWTDDYLLRHYPDVQLDQVLLVICISIKIIFDQCQIVNNIDLGRRRKKGNPYRGCFL